MGYFVICFFLLSIFIYMSVTLYRRLDEFLGSDYLIYAFLYVIVWIMTYLFYILEPVPILAIYWRLFWYLSKSMVFTSLWIFAIKYTNPFYKLRKQLILTFFIIPFLTGLFSLLNSNSNNNHGLLFSSIIITTFSPTKILSYEPGIWFYVDFLYNMLALIIPVSIFIKHYNAVAVIFKVQYLFFIASYSIIAFFQIISFINVFSGFDVAIIGTVIGCCLIYWNILYYRTSDFLVFAKDAVFEKISVYV